MAERRGIAAVPWQVWFVALAAIWGCSFWFMKVGLRGLSPVEVAFWRLALGAGALVAIAAAARTPMPRGPRTWFDLALIGGLGNSVPFLLFAYGETHVSSVLAGIINAATPLATIAFTLAVFRDEPATPHRLWGLALGFAGVLIVLGAWNGLGSGGEWRGVLACLGAVACYGIAYPYAQRTVAGTGNPVGLAAGQIGLATLLLVPALPFAWGGGGPVTGDVVAAMVCLGVFGSGIAFALTFRVVEEAGATTASTVTYLIPLFAVAAGVVFLGEGLSWHEPAGGLVVLAGVAVGSGRLPVRRLRPIGTPGGQLTGTPRAAHPGPAAGDGAGPGGERPDGG